MATLAKAGAVREQILNELNETLRELGISEADSSLQLSDAIPYNLRNNLSDPSFVQMNASELYRMLTLARLVRDLTARVNRLEALATPAKKGK